MKLFGQWYFTTQRPANNTIRSAVRIHFSPGYMILGCWVNIMLANVQDILTRTLMIISLSLELANGGFPLQRIIRCHHIRYYQSPTAMNHSWDISFTFALCLWTRKSSWLQWSTYTFHGSRPNAHFEKIWRSSTQNPYMITKIFYWSQAWFYLSGMGRWVVR